MQSKNYFFIVLVGTIPTFIITSESIEKQKKEKVETEQSERNDKELLAKIKDIQAKQLKKIGNFTPGFKTALDAFFAYEWEKALEKKQDAKIQQEIIKITNRLQDDYQQLVVQELLEALAPLGSYYSTQEIDPVSKKQLISFIEDTKNMHSDIHQAVFDQEKRAKVILSPLLEFSHLSPSPYDLWYTILYNAQQHNLILNHFGQVTIPLLQADNTATLEVHLQKAKRQGGALYAQWKAYQEKIKTFLENLESIAQQEQDLKPIFNKISSAKIKLLEFLKNLMHDMRAVHIYGSFIPSVNFVDQWLAVSNDAQKFLDQWMKASKEWQSILKKALERKKVVYEYLKDKGVMQEVENMLESDAKSEEYIALLNNVDKSLMQQKTALQTKQQAHKSK